jgi:hypothetical protein
VNWCGVSLPEEVKPPPLVGRVAVCVRVYGPSFGGRNLKPRTTTVNCPSAGRCPFTPLGHDGNLSKRSVRIFGTTREAVHQRLYCYPALTLLVEHLPGRCVPVPSRKNFEKIREPFKKACSQACRHAGFHSPDT